MFFDDIEETMPQAERERQQVIMLRQAMDYALQHAPTMGEKIKKAGITPSDIHSLKDMERIPITRKDELSGLQKKNPPFGGLSAVPADKLWMVFWSPGPIYWPYPFSEDQYRMQRKMLFAAGFVKGDIVLMTYSYHLFNAAWVTDEAMKRFGIVVVPGGVGNTETQVELMHHVGVTGYYGTPTFLLSLIKKAEEMGYTFKRDFKLRVAGVGGEMYPPSLREEIEKKYGVNTSQVYGSADVGTTAHECEQKNGMHLCEEVIYEIVDPETRKQLGPGEIGELVVTNFEKGLPLIRLAVGDLGYINYDPCPCGRTSPRLMGIVGRVGESVRIRSRFLYPRQVQEVIARFPQISRHQIVVTREAHRDYLALLAEVKDGTANSKGVVEEATKALQEISGLKIDKADIVPQGSIPEGTKNIVDKRTWE